MLACLLSSQSDATPLAPNTSLYRLAKTHAYAVWSSLCCPTAAFAPCIRPFVLGLTLLHVSFSYPPPTQQVRLAKEVLAATLVSTEGTVHPAWMAWMVIKVSQRRVCVSAPFPAFEYFAFSMEILIFFFPSPPSRFIRPDGWRWCNR